MDAPSWSTPAGTVVGWRDGPVLRASGIRYARAGRFERPVAEPPSRAPIDATRWSPVCPQARMDFLVEVLGARDELPVAEDCLRLSVTVPDDLAPDERVPVMVWLHGGSYVAGGGDLRIFDVAPLVAEQRVVVVAVTYRLGLLGYLGDGRDRPANLGLLDQVAALRWVRENISAFGGDPDLVTAFGESAGGDAVAHLMIARAAEGLLRRAIIQSAPFGVMPGRAEMSAAMMAAARAYGVEHAADDLVAAQPGLEGTARRFGLPSGMPFGVQYGHDPLPAEDELDAAWRRAAPAIDVLVGSTARETALFLGRLGGRRAQRRWLRPVVEPLVRATTERVYGAGVHDFAARHGAGGGRGYRYLLTWAIPGNPYSGAHTIDLPLLFGRPETWRAAPLVAGVDPDVLAERGRALRAIWAGFARDGVIAERSVPGLVEVREIPDPPPGGG